MAVKQSGYPVGSGSQLSESERETLALLSTAPVGLANSTVITEAPRPVHKNMAECETCSDPYDEAAGDGYCGLCPSCADTTDALMSLGFSEEEARSVWAGLECNGGALIRRIRGAA